MMESGVGVMTRLEVLGCTAGLRQHNFPDLYRVSARPPAPSLGSAVCRVILRWQSAVVRRAPVPAGWFQQAVCSCVCSVSNLGEGEFRTRIFLCNPVLCESSRLCQMMKLVITLCARSCVGKREKHSVSSGSCGISVAFTNMRTRADVAQTPTDVGKLEL